MGEDLKKTKELVDMIKNELEHLETVYDMDVRGQRLAYADVLTMVPDVDYSNDQQPANSVQNIIYSITKQK